MALSRSKPQRQKVTFQAGGGLNTRDHGLGPCRGARGYALSIREQVTQFTGRIEVRTLARDLSDLEPQAGELLGNALRSSDRAANRIAQSRLRQWS